MPETRIDDRQESPGDRLLRFFTATERLLQAADEVREAGDALVSPAADRSDESEVRHDA